MKWLLIGFIRFWRAVVSPLYGNVCKYYPSCSAYGLQAVETHGAVRGSWLAAARILRCNPWSKGGYDPVPGTPAGREWEREQQAAADTRPRTDPGPAGFPADVENTGRTVFETVPAERPPPAADPDSRGAEFRTHDSDARGVN